MPSEVPAEIRALVRKRRALRRACRAPAVLVLGIVSARCASQTSSASRPLDLGGQGVESLSGDWTGTFEVRQAGDCTVQHGDRTSERYHWRLTVHPDGAFELVTQKSGDEPGKPVLGVVGPGFRLDALRSPRAECPTGPSEIKTKLVGQVTRASEGITLELSGKESTCAKSNCVFDLRYHLVKDAAGASS